MCLFNQHGIIHVNLTPCSFLMFKTENSTKLEPIEEVTIKVNEEHVGLVIEALSHRRAKVTRWVQFEAALAELDCV
ncbi:GTP-binding protein TypA/BipA-like protein [Cucumis melo var. makuwa]|uniref:GTP-binding protein TypA/BipA-like protein n=1 Tax=Cucumis melo var. makuwa TaxID=1194695 RepID=A0A5D3CKC6_CUCMM|nr:GTP-binding protein TypA/BipA-like protein [Cucumis melo var. makuwa]